MTDVLIDTNVLVYAYDKSSVYHQRCVGLLLNSSLNFFCASKSVSEYFAVCTKMNYPVAGFTAFFNQAEQYLTVLHTSHASIRQFKHLFSKYLPKGNKVYDVEIASVMLASGVQEIATINVVDFQNMPEVKLYQF